MNTASAGIELRTFDGRLGLIVAENLRKGDVLLQPARSIHTVIEQPWAFGVTVHIDGQYDPERFEIGQYVLAFRPTEPVVPTEVDCARCGTEVAEPCLADCTVLPSIDQETIEILSLYEFVIGD